MAKNKSLKLKKIEPSVLMALLAVVISFGSVIISYKEANIMKAQQLILSEQQEASVWPYIEHNTFHAFDRGDKQTTVTFTYKATNKGIGPAIIGDVDYFFDNEKIKIGNGEIHKKIREKYPSIDISIRLINNLDNIVLSAGEKIDILIIRLTKKKDDSIKIYDIINESNIYANYCYCSVYGKCWQVKDNKTTVKSDNCNVRTDIR